MRRSLLELPPNRVRRNYRGGAQLDALEGAADPADSGRPEDWIASATEARNPGLPPVPGEGLSRVADGRGGMIFLRDLFEKYPEHYLGADHHKKFGAVTTFLAKLLDSSMRLHVQAHPTAQFAQKHLNSRWGKLETYVILGHRDGADPHIRLGFQRPPSPAEWRRIVLEQDIKAMDACFDKIPVRAGEVWIVPGGLPHAIGPGLLVMEVMEPTDLVVRCEFERDGIAVPPEARFMGRDPDFALRIFDHSAFPPERIFEECRVTPEVIYEDGAALVELLIGGRQTECFTERRVTVTGDTELKSDGRMTVGVVVRGSGVISSGRDALTARRGLKFLTAAAAETLRINPTSGESVQILLCS